MFSFLARCRGLVMFCRASLRAAASVWCIFNLFLFKKTMKELNSFYRNSITSLTSKERSIFDFSWNVVNCIFAAWRRIWQPELLSHSCCSFFGYLCCSVMCHLVQREEMNAEEAHWTFFFFCKCTTAAEVDDRITNISAPYLTRSPVLFISLHRNS